MKILGLCEEVLALDEKATKGPWEKGGTGTVICDVAQNPDLDVIYRGPEDGRCGADKDRSNRDFIAHSRENYPKLARALKVAVLELRKYAECATNSPAIEALSKIESMVQE